MATLIWLHDVADAFRGQCCSFVDIAGVASPVLQRMNQKLKLACERQYMLPIDEYNYRILQIP